MNKIDEKEFERVLNVWIETYDDSKADGLQGWVACCKTILEITENNRWWPVVPKTRWQRFVEVFK